MKKAFVIVTVADRVDRLNLLFGSMMEFLPDFSDWDICVFFQGDKKQAEKLNTRSITKFYYYPELLGCNAARIALLKQNEMRDYDIYCNLDDDILLTKYTNYAPAIEKCLKHDTGFVLTNWGRTANIVDQKAPKMKDEFVKQALIYQGGGMLYSNKIANIVRTLPTEKTVFDEGWPLVAYLNGYTNYRYLGSLSVHEICTKGGMNGFYKNTDYSKLKLSFGDYIDYKMGKDGRWKIPMDKDLTQKAKLTHKANLK